jgi:hypothetical protein
LLKGAPETVETSLARRGCRRSGGGRHNCILAQNPERNLARDGAEAL